VQFGVKAVGDKTVVLVLDNTRFGRRNDTQRMDTSFFSGPVAQVDPKQGPAHSIEIAIHLKGKATYQAHQDGGEVSVDFPLTSAQ
jgi:hypothetical protein